MNLSSIDNLFKKPVKKVFILSEETIATLKRWELNESEALMKLQRMMHTAPASERAQIRKAIAELQKKEKSKESGTENRKFYTIIGLSGTEDPYIDEMTGGDSITPDYWWHKKSSNWADDSVKTFIYIPYTDKMIVSEGIGYQYAHHELINDSVDEGIISMEDIGPEYREVGERQSWDIVDILNDEDLQDRGVAIHGRTGPIPLRGEPDETEIYAAIWQHKQPRDMLDDMMYALNDALPSTVRNLIVPEDV